MFKNLLRRPTTAERVAQAEQELTAARAALDTAWQEYGSATAEARAAGGDPESTREAAALNRASRQVSALEAELDYLRGEHARAEQNEAEKAERAKAEQQRAAGAELAAAVEAFEPAADAMASRAKAVFDALENFIAACPDAMHSRTDMNLGIGAVINYRMRFVPGIRQSPFMDEVRGRLEHYLPPQVRDTKRRASDH